MILILIECIHKKYSIIYEQLLYALTNQILFTNLKIQKSLELKAKLLAEKKELEEKQKVEEHNRKVLEHCRMRDEAILMIEEDRNSRKYEKVMKAQNKKF